MTREYARDATGACITTIPAWEDPIYRFLQGEAELKLQVIANGIRTEGPALTLAELLAAPELCPIRIADEAWTYEDICQHVIELLIENGILL